MAPLPVQPWDYITVWNHCVRNTPVQYPAWVLSFSFFFILPVTTSLVFFGTAVTMSIWRLKS